MAEQRTLAGKFLDKIYQCGERTFLFRLSPGKVFLRLDATPGAARALVTDAPPPVPDHPPVFGSILRKEIGGGRLADARLLSRDRVQGFDVEFEGGIKRVVLEAIGRHPNLLLLDGCGRVLRVLDGDVARRRQTSVGALYRLPEPPDFRDEKSLLPVPPPLGPFATNHFLDGLYASGEEEGGAEQQEKARQKTLDRLERTRRAVESDLASLPDAAALRRQGGILLEHFPELHTGLREFQGVPLDPRLNPQENVERLFERARKAERAAEELTRRLAEIDAEIERLRAGGALSESRLQALRSRKGEKPRPRLPYRTFTSADGLRILVGKGGRDNDELTLRIAGPHDLFLHVRGTPGSHVIVPLRRGAELPQETLLDAATLAMHYSKSRKATAADVSYTLRKYVSKPRGAKPGLVQLRQERVFRLRREPERLTRLLMTAGRDEDQ